MYILDLDRLQIGDIILESGTSAASWVIKKGTNSNYSHAMLYVGNSIIHALSDSGVYSKNPQRILVNSLDDLKVLRLKKEVDIDDLNSVVNHARSLVGSLYSIPEAAMARFKNTTDSKGSSPKQFCSRLVANAYSNAGFHLVANADYCSPEDINQSSLLIEVPNCVREAIDEEIKISESWNPVLENQKRTFDYLGKCRKLFKKKRIDIQSETDVQEALVVYPEYDNEVCSFILDSKYLELYDADKKLNPYRYDFFLFLQEILNKSIHPNDLNEILFDELKLLTLNLHRYSENYLRSAANYHQYSLKYFSLMQDLFKNLLTISKEHLNAIGLISKQFDLLDVVQDCETLLKATDDVLQNKP